jgi:hypothetical protein
VNICDSAGGKLQPRIGDNRARMIDCGSRCSKKRVGRFSDPWFYILGSMTLFNETIIPQMITAGQRPIKPSGQAFAGSVKVSSRLGKCPGTTGTGYVSRYRDKWDVSYSERAGTAMCPVVDGRTILTPLSSVDTYIRSRGRTSINLRGTDGIKPNTGAAAWMGGHPRWYSWKFHPMTPPLVLEQEANWTDHVKFSI